MQKKLIPRLYQMPKMEPLILTGALKKNRATSWNLSAGFGGGIGLTGTLGVSFNNFSIKNITKRSTWDPLPSGDGQKLSARIQSNGKAFRSYNFSFTEPWLGGKKRNSFTIGYSNTKYANAYDGFGQLLQIMWRYLLC